MKTALILFIPWIICLIQSYKDKKLFQKNIVGMMISISLLSAIGGIAYVSYTPSSGVDFTLVPFFLGLMLVFFIIGIVRLYKTIHFLKQEQ